MLGLLLLSPGAQRAVLARSTGDLYVAALDRADRYFEAVAKLRSLIDRSQFDVDSLAVHLAFEEPDAIVAWVRDNIAFEQYPGLLRGPRGTLMSRAGNALDQAVLLAGLLNAVGFEAVVVEGSLDATSAEALLDEIGPPSADLPWADPEAFAAALRELASLNPPGATELEGMLAELVSGSDVLESNGVAFGEDLFRDDLELVFSVLAEADFGFDDQAVVAALLDEAADYYWVEYKLTEAHPSTEAHPAFTSGRPPVPPVPSGEVFASAIPQHLQHRIRLQAFIEQKLGDRLVIHPVTGPWEQPSANLHGIVQVFGNAPTNLTSLNDLLDLDNVLGGVEFFAPTFQGSLADGGQFFDIRGNVVPPDAAADPAAGVVREVGGRFGRAAGALDGGGDPAEFVAITAQWIEYTLIAPGGEERLAQRVVFDRVGPANRARNSTELGETMTQEEVAAALTGSHALMVNVGYLPGAYVLDELLRTVEASAPVVAAVIERAAYPDRFTGPFPDGIAVDESPLHLLRLYSTFDAATFGDDIRGYRSAPSLVIVSQGITSTNRDHALYRFGVDIVANERRHIRVASEAAPTPVPEASVAAGIWETHVERQLFDAEDSVRSSVQHVRTVIEEARAAGATLRLLQPEDVSVLGDLAIDAQSRASLERDLRAGYAAVIPVAADEVALATAWWRIHPDTGETLGITSDGRGSVLLEYLKMWALGFIVGFVACAILNMVLTGVVRHAQGEVWHEGAPITPHELVQCVVTGLATGALTAAIAVPHVSMVIPGHIGTALPVRIWGGYTMAQFKTAVSALNIGFGFVLVQLNQYLVPADWSFAD